MALEETADDTADEAGDIATARTYIHRQCGGATEIDGLHYRFLCSPLENIKSTMCAGCQAAARVEDVYWADTGESVGDYRRRMSRDHTPPWAKPAVYVVAPLLLLEIVVGVYFLLGGILWPTVTLIVIWLVWKMFAADVVSRIMGLDYRRIR